MIRPIASRCASTQHPFRSHTFYLFFLLISAIACSDDGAQQESAGAPDAGAVADQDAGSMAQDAAGEPDAPVAQCNDGAVACSQALDCAVPTGNSCETAVCASGCCAIVAAADGAVCDDGIACTDGRCKDGACGKAASIKPGNCFIDGVCIPTGTAEPTSHGCRACLPETSQITHTPLTDGADCAKDGHACLPGSCTDGACQLAGIATGFCFISTAKDGGCYADQALDPSNQCQRCNAAGSQSSWSPAAADTPCKADDVVCTKDACDGMGDCVATPDDGACSAKDTACSVGVCDPKQFGCAVAPLPESATCIGSDGVTCTVETCDGQGKCNDKGQTTDDLCDDQVKCTNDACVQGQGCVFSPDAKAHCDDGNECTDDSCDALKDCQHNNNKAACKADDLQCTLDACDAGTCKAMTDAGFCVIDGKTCAKKDDTSAQGCLICDPAKSQEQWSNAGIGAKCDGDGVECTADACDGKGVCASKLAADHCMIDKACHKDGALKEGSGDCLRCDSKTKTDAWTAVAKGAACKNDNIGCTVDTCDGAGKCVNTTDDLKCVDAYGCTANRCDAKLDCQFIDNCAWGHVCNKDVNACTTDAPVILVKQSKDDPAPTNPAAVRHVLDPKTGRQRLWVVYQSQSCATASSGTWAIDKPAALRAVVLDTQIAAVDKKVAPVIVTLDAALKGADVCQGYPVVAVDPESSSQAWVSWLEAGVGDSPICLDSNGRGGVLRLALLDGTAAPQGATWAKAAGANPPACTLVGSHKPLFGMAGFTVFDGIAGSQNEPGKRELMSMRPKADSLDLGGENQRAYFGSLAALSPSTISPATAEYDKPRTVVVDTGAQAKPSDSRYLMVAAEVDGAARSLWALPFDSTGAKGTIVKWLDATAEPSAGGLKGISAICGLDAAYNATTGEVGVALVARDVNGGKDDRVFLVTKKGADKAKLVTIEGAGTVATGGACHYGLMAARVVATKDGFAVLYYGADNPGDPGKPSVASVVFANDKATVGKTAISGMSVWPTDSSAEAKSVPALAWRGLADLIVNSDGTLSVIGEVKKVAERALAVYTFKP